MHIVVNHLELAEPLTDGTAVAARKTARLVIKAGARSFHLVKVDETHLVLVQFFDSAADAERISREIGDPWIREHLDPLLAAPTDRSFGDAIVGET